MKNVIVLIDDEEYKSPLLYDKKFGMYNTTEMMCAITTPHYEKAFNFQVFGLLTLNSKLDEYIKTRDGIIIIVTHSTNSVIDRIYNIIRQNDVPIMLYFENKYNDLLQLSPRPTESNNPPLSMEEIWNPDGMGIRKLSRDKHPNINNTDTATYFKKNFEPKYSNFKVFSDKDSANRWFTYEMRILSVPNPEGSDTERRHLKPAVAIVKTEQTSKTIPISEMAKQFEEGTLPMALWDHYGRLRIVHYALMQYGYKAASDPNEWLCTSWRAYKTSINHGHLWHYTLTRFWMTILYDLQNKYKYQSFDDLYNAHPEIHSGSFFKSYYTDDVLFTPNARANWVYPNLRKF